MNIRINSTVRAATKTDASAACDVLRTSIAECCVEDHRNDPMVLSSWLKNKTPENVEAWITSASNFAVVAIVDNHLVGLGLMSLNGEIRLCYITPEVRFTGIGKALLHAMEQEAARKSLKELHLNSTATGRSFYQRNGCQQTGAPEEHFGVKSYPCGKLFDAMLSKAVDASP